MAHPRQSKLDRKELALLDAARAGQTSVVRELLDGGVAVDVRDNRGVPRDVTPLMWAAGRGHVDTVCVLLAAGAEPGARDRHVPGEPAGRTALHYAARGRHLEVARAVLEAGAPVNAVGTGGVGTPLHDAIEGEERSRPSLAEIRKGITRHEPDAAERAAILAFARFLLSSGANPNVADGNGNCPLFDAVRRGFGDVAEALLDAGADVNHQNNVGWTAFVGTIQRKNTDAALLLLRRGLDVTLKDQSDWTALHWAVPTGSVQFVQAVLDRRPAVNDRDREGRTPLDLALQNGQGPIAELLTRAGARKQTSSTR